MPRDEDAKLAGIELKDRVAEERAILDIACAVRAFHFRKAKWNQGAGGEEGIGSQQVIVRLRENLEFDREFLEDYEPDWKYVAWWNNKVSYQQGAKDTDSKCNATVTEGTLTHSLLSQAIESQASTQAYQTSIDYSRVEFNDTIKKTLRLLRLLSFS
jgi:cancer susceptibility candidate protein 1